MMKTAQVTCGLSKSPCSHKETWWWNEEVAEAVREKQKKYWFYLPGFTFLVPAHLGSPRQNPESRKMVVCVCVCRQTGLISLGRQPA